MIFLSEWVWLLLIFLLLGGGPLAVVLLFVAAACVRYVFTGEWPK